MDVVKRARDYLAMNAAESGADVLIRELCDEVERTRHDEREACAQVATSMRQHRIINSTGAVVGYIDPPPAAIAEAIRNRLP